MAFEQPGFQIGQLNANADLSTYQYCAVKLADASGTAEVALAAVSGEVILGILQNKPVAGAVASVMTSGISKVKVGAAVTAGAKLMVDVTTGRLITATGAGKHIVGFALGTAGANGDIISAYILGGHGVV